MYGQICQANVCYKVYSGVASRYIQLGVCNGCQDVLDTCQDGASGPLS